MPLVTGTLLEEEAIGGNATETRRRKYASDKLDYVAGGLTFNWPAGYFMGPPRVLISIELKNAPYSPAGILIHVVTANTAAATTVRVNKGSIAGGITEALTDDFSVTILAVR